MQQDRSTSADGAAFATPPSEESTPPRDVEALYRTEIQRTVRHRLDLTVMLLLAFVGVSVFMEQRAHPERMWPVLITYLIEAAIGIAAVAACRVRTLTEHTVKIAAGMATVLAVVNGLYIRVQGGDVESLAMAQVCLMTGLAAMLPWGWAAQLTVCSAALAGFFIAVSGVPHMTPEPWAVLGVWVGAVTSFIGVTSIDRYRHAAFVRATLLTRLSTMHREEAETSRALVQVSEALSQRVGRAGVLVAVNRIAVEVLGCDWSTTLVPDATGRAFRFVADFGSQPAVCDELDGVDLPLAELPIFERLRPGELVEIADVQRQALIPVELLRRWDMASALWTPVHRDAEIVAIIVTGCRDRSGPFSDKQRRLALGIAHAVAIALENERLIRDLQAADRLKSDFVATMSHELRTPLNVILGYAEMLSDLDREWSSNLSLPLVRRIRGSAVELLELVDATLNLARLQSGRDVVFEVPVAVQAIFSELGDELDPLRVKSRATLRWSNRVPGAIVTDRTKLKTILKNLVGNALKYGGEGTVEVTSRLLDDDHLELVVRDGGVGIAGENLPTIFDMFRQVESASTNPFGGVGLGLYIVKQLVDRLHGEITVESTVGAGSTFTVRVPTRFPTEDEMPRPRTLAAG